MYNDLDLKIDNIRMEIDKISVSMKKEEPVGYFGLHPGNYHNK